MQCSASAKWLSLSLPPVNKLPFHNIIEIETWRRREAGFSQFYSLQLLNAAYSSLYNLLDLGNRMHLIVF